ncbi:leucine-rich repeat and transmembrane domain-containing protein 1 [Spea bombifrons]|uniref:leucine-rich repeat and transmembrane domain-containing protein 1 n=1 Tax=Spea bombifrons TaxID=233779 RepID=UPI00234A8C2A|nr:leucine-rich repeat and transmembrane domain-containing protein 1 [Spea bombifrons]
MLQKNLQPDRQRAAMRGGVIFLSSFMWLLHVARGCPDVCKCLTSAKTVDCSYRGLLEIPNHFPPQTQILYMQGNQIRIINHTSFASVPGLKILDLSNNSVSLVSPHAFHLLRSLQILNLSNNFIHYLENQVFISLLDLKELDLSSNRIFGLPESLGNNTRNLTFLGVKHNRLQRMDKSLLESFTNLKVLLIRDNPWQCNCHTMGLKFWLENFLYKGGTIDELICNSPENRRGKDLLTLPLDIFKGCPPASSPSLMTNTHHHSVEHRSNSRHGFHADHADGSILPECEPKAKARPVSLRHAIATVVITGVVCGIVCLMMLAAAVYGCAYAAIMAKYHRELKEVEHLAPAGEHGSPEEREPLDRSLA